MCTQRNVGIPPTDSLLFSVDSISSSSTIAYCVRCVRSAWRRWCFLSEVAAHGGTPSQPPPSPTQTCERARVCQTHACSHETATRSRPYIKYIYICNLLKHDMAHERMCARHTLTNTHTTHTTHTRRRHTCVNIHKCVMQITHKRAARVAAKQIEIEGSAPHSLTRMLSTNTSTAYAIQMRAIKFPVSSPVPRPPTNNQPTNAPAAPTSEQPHTRRARYNNGDPNMTNCFSFPITKLSTSTTPGPAARPSRQASAHQRTRCFQSASALVLFIQVYILYFFNFFIFAPSSLSLRLPCSQRRTSATRA